MVKETRKPELNSGPKRAKELNYDFAAGDWNADNFVQYIQDAEELSKLDVEKADGFKKVHNYLGNEPSVLYWNPQQVDGARKSLVDMAHQETGEYSFAHRRSLADLLTEQERFGFTVQNPIYKGVSASYDATAGDVEHMQKTESNIKKDPRGYMEQRLDGYEDAPLSRQFWMEHADAVMQGDMQKAIRDAVDSLRNYGSSKFITDNVSQARKTYEGLEAGVKRYQEAVQTIIKESSEALQAKQDEVGGPLNYLERTAVMAPYQERQKELEKSSEKLLIDYQNATKGYQKLMGDLQGFGYQKLVKQEESN